MKLENVAFTVGDTALVVNKQGGKHSENHSK